MLKQLVLLALIVQMVSAGVGKSSLKKPADVKPPTLSNHLYTVLKVSDGDTATLRNKTNNQIVKVRFLCIDAPEKSQGKWGLESLKRLSDLLPLGADVRLQGDKTDLYQRTVSEVITKSGLNVNKKMVETGHAVFYPFQKGCGDYAELEKKAKKAKLGVWSDASFETPWDYRARHCIGMRCNKSKTTTTTRRN